MIGLMVVHGAAAGNFSPLNVLSAVVTQALARGGLEAPTGTLFLGNLAYNMALAVVISLVFGGRRRNTTAAAFPPAAGEGMPASGSAPRACASTRCARCSRSPASPWLRSVFGLNIGFVALTAGAALHLCFPASSAGAEKQIAWSVVLLVCGIVTYVGCAAALWNG